MEISFDHGQPITYILTEEEFREWRLTRERLKQREEEINRLHEIIASSGAMNSWEDE